MDLISVDLGLRDIALAYFVSKKLCRTWYISNPENKLRGPKAWVALCKAIDKEVPLKYLAEYELVFETMDVYAHGKARSSDLLELVGLEGCISGFFDPFNIVHYLPKQWKGQVPKSIHNKRVLAELTKEEQAKVLNLPASSRHNVIDAVGIGLHHLHRV